jgi:hypothetical protein
MKEFLFAPKEKFIDMCIFKKDWNINYFYDALYKDGLIYFIA